MLHQSVVPKMIQETWKFAQVTQKYVRDKFCPAGLEKVREEEIVNDHLPKATRNMQVVKVGFVACCMKGARAAQTTVEGLGKREFRGA